MYSEKITERLGAANALNPVSQAAATVTSPSIDMQKFHRAYAIINNGAVTGTLDAKWQESSDNASFTDLAGTNVAMAQVTTANKTNIMEVRSDQITKRYVRISATVGTGPVLLCIQLYGDEAVNKPGNAQNGNQIILTAVA